MPLACKPSCCGCCRKRRCTAGRRQADPCGHADADASGQDLKRFAIMFVPFRPILRLNEYTISIPPLRKRCETFRTCQAVHGYCEHRAFQVCRGFSRRRWRRCCLPLAWDVRSFGPSYADGCWMAEDVISEGISDWTQARQAIGPMRTGERSSTPGRDEANFAAGDRAQQHGPR